MLIYAFSVFFITGLLLLIQKCHVENVYTLVFEKWHRTLWNFKNHRFVKAFRKLSSLKELHDLKHSFASVDLFFFSRAACILHLVVLYHFFEANGRMPEKCLENRSSCGGHDDPSLLWQIVVSHWLLSACPVVVFRSRTCWSSERESGESCKTANSLLCFHFRQSSAWSLWCIVCSFVSVIHNYTVPICRVIQLKL